MSDDPNTAADLFADDIIRIVMSRLQVRLSSAGYNRIAVQLVDGKTGYAYQCEGPQLFPYLTLTKDGDGNVKDAAIVLGEGY